jgi:hypothetical protein
MLKRTETYRIISTLLVTVKNKKLLVKLKITFLLFSILFDKYNIILII